MKNYGKALKTLRRRSDMTQAELAEKLNVTYQTVSKWENGVNRPDISAIEDICATLSVSVEEFLRVAEEVSGEDAAPAVASVSEEMPAPSVAPVTACAVSAAAKKKDTDIPYYIIAAVLAVLILVGSLCVGLSGRKLSATQIYEKVNPSVFYIEVEGDDGNTYGGSGFFIDKNGTAVTNYHVIEKIVSAKVKLSGGATYSVDKIVGLNTVRDLAVIHVNIPKSKPVELADSNKVKVGETVYAIGYPQSFILGSQDSTLTQGIVSKSSYSVEGMNYIQSTVDITHGNSGGVLVNSRGKVIGVTTAGIDVDNVNYMNFSVPSNSIKSVGSNVNLSVERFVTEFRKKINVTYMLGGKVYAVKSIYSVEEVPDLQITVAGGKFHGWYDDAKFTVPHDFGVKAEGDLTLYGKVAYNPVVTYYIDGEVYETKELLEGDTAPDLSVNRDNLKFHGWYDDKELTVPHDFSQKITENKSLYARVTFDNVTVKFLPEGGSGAQGNVLAKGASDFLMPECKFRRAGYTFGGWSYGGKIYAAGESAYIDGNESVAKISAVWQPVSYTVKFSYEGDEREYTYVYGERHVLPKALFSRTGYKQSGWVSGGKTYGLGETVSDFTPVASSTVTLAPEWTAITYTLRVDLNGGTLYGSDAEYIDVPCTYGIEPSIENYAVSYYYLEIRDLIIYDDSGSEYTGDRRYLNAVEGKTVRASIEWISGRYRLYLKKNESHFISEYDYYTVLEGREECTLPLMNSETPHYPAPEGYRFSYWVHERADLDEPEVRYADGATVCDLMPSGYVYGGYALGGTICRVDLYAVWEPIPYAVKFDAGTGSGSMESLDCVYDTSFVLPTCGFTKSGYTFVGWRFGEKTYAPGASVINASVGGEATFTAQWAKSLEGEGTERSPYLVGDYDSLYALSAFVDYSEHYATAHYALTADIDCGGKELYAIGKTRFFRGTFDGNYHVINSPVFAVSADEAPIGYIGTSFQGLFGKVFDGAIRNVGIRNYVIPSSEGCSKAGSLAAQITTSKPVENCFSEGKIISAGNVGSVGGLFGSLKGYAVNCYTRTDITVTYDCAAQQYSSTWKIGGFAAEIGCGASSIGTEHGNLECVVEVGGAENCYASGDILITGGTPNVRHYIGTFVGGFESARKYVYKNCFALGTIDYTGYRPGGLSSDFCGPFVGSQSPFNLTTENLYVCVTVTGHDGAKDDFKCTAATREELCSLDFLEANMSFDRNIWAQNESEPPALKAYEVNL